MSGLSALLLVVLLCLAAAACAAPPDVYVSQSGVDTAPGTSDQPVATIAKGISKAQVGATVWVAPGTYVGIGDSTVRSGAITIRGWNGRPTLDKIWLAGSTGIHVRDVNIVGQVLLTDDVNTHTRPTGDVELIGLDVTAPNVAYCVAMRSGTYDVLIEKSHIHDCQTGILGPHSSPVSSHITIRDNRLERFLQDGIQFADWNDVEITGNLIQDINDPANVIHNDALQFVGNSHRVVIADNELARSGNGQLLLVQDAVGPIDDVLVQNNLIHEASGYAVQTQGATNARFIGNTIWRSFYGGLLVRAGQRTLPDGTHTVPTDTVVRDNVLSGLGTAGGAVMGENTRNALPCPTATDVACAADSTFVAIADGDYRVDPLSAIGPALIGWRPKAAWTSPGPGILTPDSGNPSPTPTPTPTPSPMPTPTPVVTPTVPSGPTGTPPKARVVAATGGVSSVQARHSKKKVATRRVCVRRASGRKVCRTVKVPTRSRQPARARRT